MTRSELNAYIEARLTDNSSNQITPVKHREVEFALADYIEQLTAEVAASAADAVSFQGVFDSLDALNSGVASPEAGDFAQVNDGGTLVNYQYNATSETWVEMAAAPTVVEVTLGQLQDLIADSNLIIGASYKVIMPSNEFVGLVSPGGLYCIFTKALSGHVIDNACVGTFMVQDWSTVGTNVFGLPQYAAIEPLTGYEPFINRGPWSAASEGGYNNGDFVFRDGFTYQVQNNTAFNGAIPEDNPAAYIKILKPTTGDTAYIPELNFIIWDGQNTFVNERRDSRGNIALSDGLVSYDKMNLFKWGSNDCVNNFLDRKVLVWNCNDLNGFNNNKITGWVGIQTAFDFYFTDCRIHGNNQVQIFAETGYLSACSIEVSGPISLNFTGEHYARMLTNNSSNFTLEYDLNGDTVADLSNLNWVGILIVQDSTVDPCLLRRIIGGPSHQLEVRAKNDRTVQIGQFDENVTHPLGDSFIFSKRLPVTLSKGNHFVRIKKKTDFWPNGTTGDGPFEVYEPVSVYDGGIIQPEQLGANPNVMGPHFTGKYIAGKALFEYIEIFPDTGGFVNNLSLQVAPNSGDGSFFATYDLNVQFGGDDGSSGSPSYGPHSNITSLVSEFNPVTGTLYFSQFVKQFIIVKIQFLKNV